MSFELSRRTLLAGVGAGAVASIAWGGLPASAVPTSPAVSPDGHVTFTFESGTALTVGVVGGWISGWPQTPVPMTQSSPGVWSVTVGPLAADWYSYHFVVDGVNTRDPHNPNPVPSSTSDCMFMVSGAGTAFMEERPVPHGTVTPLNYHSAVTDSMRQATVYTPASYTETKQYPLFVLMHGGGGDQWDWVVQGRANIILDNMIADGLIAPMVVVMPSVMLPGGLSGVMSPRADLVPGEVLDSLIPAVEKRYNVFSAHTMRALAGLSMGGFYTWSTLLTRPGEFAWYGDFSSGYFPNGIENLRGADADLFDNKKINTKTKLHAIYCDPTDIAYANNVPTRQVFDDFGVDYTFTNQPGSQGHSWHTWRLNLTHFAPRIF